MDFSKKPIILPQEYHVSKHSKQLPFCFFRVISVASFSALVLLVTCNLSLGALISEDEEQPGMEEMRARPSNLFSDARKCFVVSILELFSHFSFQIKWDCFPYSFTIILRSHLCFCFFPLSIVFIKPDGNLTYVLGNYRYLYGC